MPQPTKKTYVIRFKDGSVDRVKAHEVKFLPTRYNFMRDGKVVAAYQTGSVCS